MSEPVRIPLGRKVVVAHALVDAADADRISAHAWRMTGGYPSRTELVDGRPRTVYMHREVLGLERGDGVVDHVNGNALDNRRANLRVGTQAQNNQNKPPREFRGGSVFRGVSRGSTNRWAAVAGGKNLGYFRLELDAARAAEAYRQEHMPFAEPDPRLAEYEAELERAA